MARPTKLTPAMSERILEAIRGGNYIQTACECAGIDDSTYRRWMEKGAAGRQPYCVFRAAVQRALAEAELFHVANIRAAAATTWQASAWYLERKYPERWGRRERQEVAVTGRQKLVVDLAAHRSIEELTDDELIERARAILDDLYTPAERKARIDELIAKREQSNPVA